MLCGTAVGLREMPLGLRRLWGPGRCPMEQLWGSGRCPMGLRWLWGSGGCLMVLRWLWHWGNAPWSCCRADGDTLWG